MASTYTGRFCVEDGYFTVKSEFGQSDPVRLIEGRPGQYHDSSGLAAMVLRELVVKSRSRAPGALRS
jgi:hypothetical protein